MVLIAVTCPYCQSDHITKRGKTDTDKQRYRCHNPNCPHQSFLLHPAYKESIQIWGLCRLGLLFFLNREVRIPAAEYCPEFMVERLDPRL